jgi:hypothetical protein
MVTIVLSKRRDEFLPPATGTLRHNPIPGSFVRNADETNVRRDPNRRKAYQARTTLVGEEVRGRRKLSYLRGREVAERSNGVEVETRNRLEVRLLIMTKEDRHKDTDHSPINFVSLEVDFASPKLFEACSKAGSGRTIDVAAGGAKVREDLSPRLASEFREKRAVEAGVAKWETS